MASHGRGGTERSDGGTPFGLDTWPHVPGRTVSAPGPGQGFRRKCCPPSKRFAPKRQGAVSTALPEACHAARRATLRQDGRSPPTLARPPESKQNSIERRASRPPANGYSRGNPHGPVSHVMARLRGFAGRSVRALGAGFGPDLSGPDGP